MQNQETSIGVHKRGQRRMHVSNTILSFRGGDSAASSSRQKARQSVDPKLLVEFDTSIRSTKDMQNRIDNDALTNSIERPTLSLTFDVSQCLHPANATTIMIQQPESVYVSNELQLRPTTPTVPLTTLWTLVSQSALLLPSLLITRRLLNSTCNAVVDYFRGRYLRTTFTRLERAYLRYYEFPAATRAVFRVASQIGILMSLSWMVRWWMWMVLKTGGEDVTLSTFIDATRLPLKVSWDFEDGCLPCHRAERGIPWLCSAVWVASVVGTGHACAMAVS